MNEEISIKKAAELIASLESFRSNAYLDQKGIATIGYGTIEINGKHVQLGDKITQKDAFDLLIKRVGQDFGLLNSFCEVHKISLSDEQVSAILSFIYNCGFENFCSSSMAQDLIRNEPNVAEKVASDLLKWNKIRIGENLVYSQGLYNRRLKEASLFKNEKASEAVV